MNSDGDALLCSAEAVWPVLPCASCACAPMSVFTWTTILAIPTYTSLTQSSSASFWPWALHERSTLAIQLSQCFVSNAIATKYSCPSGP